MSWADNAIKELQSGKTVQIRPRGNSMKPKVKDGALVTLNPCQASELKEDDIVLVRVNGRVYLHLIKATRQGKFLIGNNRGGLNGWVGPQAIYGLATQVEN
jgi:hypothetical protein